MAAAEPPDEPGSELISVERTVEVGGVLSDRKTIVDLSDLVNPSVVSATITVEPQTDDQGDPVQLSSANIIIDPLPGTISTGRGIASVPNPPGTASGSIDVGDDKNGVVSVGGSNAIVTANVTVVAEGGTIPEEPEEPEEPEQPPTEPSPGDGTGAGACNPGEAQFTLPLAWANNIPGVSGIDDWTICIPTVPGIVNAIDNTLPSLDEIREAASEEIEEAIEDIPAPVVEVDEGLFGDTLDNLGEIVENAIEENIPELPDVEETLQDIQDGIDQVVEDVVDDLSEPIEDAQEAIDDVQEDIEELDPLDGKGPVEFFLDLLEDAVEDAPGINILLNPAEFIDNQIDRVTDGLVDQEDVEELQETIDRIQGERGDN
jgi:hypothetical protein